LILGVLPLLCGKLKGNRISLSHIVILILAMAVLIAIPLSSQTGGGKLMLTSTPLHLLLSVGLGFIAAATMVIPGVSGSAILLLIGYYDSVLGYVNEFTAGLLSLNGNALGRSLLILLPFTIGAVLGIVLTSRVIKALLLRYPVSTYYGILGLVLASPFAVLHQFDFQTVSTGGWIMGGLFFIGMTIGRGVSGFIAMKLRPKQMVRLGQVMMVLGGLLLFVPGQGVGVFGLLFMGLGCAPVYPNIVQDTPRNFGAENSQAVIGVQMAFAYMGSLTMPTVFGWLAEFMGYGILPVFSLALMVLMIVLFNGQQRIVDARNNK